MRILVFTTLYPNNVFPNHGVFVKERISHLARLQGCEVKVVAPVPYFPPVRLGQRWRYSQVVRQEVIEGVEVAHPRYFLTPKVGMSFYGAMMYRSVLPFMKRVQERFDFDLIDSHYVYPDGFAAVQLARSLRKPVTVSARGSDIHEYASYPLIRRRLRSTLGEADGIVAVSDSLKKCIVDLGVPESRITTIPNGVDDTKFHPVPRAEARRRLKLPEGPIILSVGRLVPLKGFDLLIKALRILRDEFQHKDLSLVILGDGPERQSLAHTARSLGLSDRVMMANAVPHAELPLWYSAADLSCLASSREGWPNVVLESMACGTPVVAAKVGGIPEIIRSDRVGLLTERGERPLALGIQEALRRSWQSDAIVDFARQHSWQRAAVSIKELFSTVLASRS